jgi:hypothetical protein
MLEGPAYLLLNRNGEPLGLMPTLDRAMDAAYEIDPSGTFYLDAPTGSAIEETEALAANHRGLPILDDRAPTDALRALAIAMRRDADRLIDYGTAMSMTLSQAHAKIVQFFPTHKVFEDGTISPVNYADPVAMVERILGQNYKTEKSTPPSIIRKLYADTGFRKANVLGLSLLPNTQSYTETMVKQIMATAAATYGVGRVKPVRLNTCVRATVECSSSCLAFSGRNLSDDYNTVRKYALLQALIHEPEAFVRVLWEAVALHRDSSTRGGFMPLIRLNVFSDLPWELMVPGLFTDFPTVQFYDYTKVPGRQTPENYDLTFSFAGTEKNVVAMDAEIRRGCRVAVVFAAVGLKRMFEVEYSVDGSKRRVRTGAYARSKIGELAKGHEAEVRSLGEVEIPKRPSFTRRKPGGKKKIIFNARLPDTFLGLPVIDGDESDMRPYDPAPSIVGLRWKTPANQGVTLEEANVFVVLVDVVPSGGGYAHCIVSKTARFDGVDYTKYAPSVTD